MKKLFLILPVILLFTGRAVSNEISLDVSAIRSSEPYEQAGAQVGSTVGFGAGGSIDLTGNLQGRLDAGYFKYKKKLTYWRLPVFMGARYMITGSPVSLFAEFGFEVHFDNEEVEGEGYVKEVNPGLAPGAGLLFPVTGPVSAGVGSRFHYVDDSYYSIGLFLNIKL